ncbi:MAG: molybdopterin molybdotransferase MoeA [Novosphingobium sp.]
MKPPPLPLEEAQTRLLALATALPVERVDVASALGRYLAEPLTARRTQPAAHLSAMDGYAVCGSDLPGPWTVIGESAAGHPFGGAVAAGQAVRLATGALLPPGADAVVLQEDVALMGDALSLTGTPPSPANRHVRHCGSDFHADHVLLPAGARLGPAQLALALAAGHNHLAVRRKVRVAILDSGDELSADAEACAQHQIPASNGTMLAAMVAAVPCQVQRIGPVRDDLDTLKDSLEQAVSADVIVTTGGASVGDHDLIRPALESWGAQLDFWRVAIKPGKPLLVATRAHQIILGLPGNPVSSHVTAYHFLLPLLRMLLGAAQPLPRAIRLPLQGSVGAGGERREFLRARLVPAGVEPLTTQDSGALAAMAAADGLIDRPAGAAAKTPGDVVEVYLLGNGSIA